MPRVLTRQGDIRKEAEDIYASLVANQADLPHLAMSIETLGELIRLVQGLTTQQVALRAGKQSASKELDATLIQLRKLVTFLRTCLKQHYGDRNQKLLEFMIQPLRPRATEVKPPPAPEDLPALDTPATPQVTPKAEPTASES